MHQPHYSSYTAKSKVGPASDLSPDREGIPGENRERVVHHLTRALDQANDELAGALDMIAELRGDLGAAQQQIRELRAQLEQAGRDPTHAVLSAGAERRRSEVRTLWRTYGEHAALTGQAPPFLRSLHTREETFRFALGTPPAQVIGEALVDRGLPPLVRRGRPLVGACPLCGSAASLHVHDYDAHRTWGCKACGRFGDSYVFAVLYQRLGAEAEKAVAS